MIRAVLIIVVTLAIGECFADAIDLLWWGGAAVLALASGCPTLTGDA